MCRVPFFQNCLPFIIAVNYTAGSTIEQDEANLRRPIPSQIKVTSYMLTYTEWQERHGSLRD